MAARTGGRVLWTGVGIDNFVRFESVESAGEIMGELGIRYDSSIYPVVNYRYGIADAPRWPHAIGTGALHHQHRRLLQRRHQLDRRLAFGRGDARVHPVAIDRHLQRRAFR